MTTREGDWWRKIPVSPPPPPRKRSEGFSYTLNLIKFYWKNIVKYNVYFKISSFTQKMTISNIDENTLKYIFYLASKYFRLELQSLSERKFSSTAVSSHPNGFPCLRWGSLLFLRMMLEAGLWIKKNAKEKNYRLFNFKIIFHLLWILYDTASLHTWFLLRRISLDSLIADVL